MSTVTLPPTGAKVRATITYPDGTVSTLEGIATAVSESFIDLGAGYMAIRLKPESGETVAVEVLELPPPPEPGDGTVVTTGKKVFLRQITATHGAQLSWWRTADDEPWTWEQVCSTGAPIRLVLVSPGDAPDLPWTHADADGDTLSITPNLQNDRLWVSVRAADNVNLFRREAAELGRALLAWAGEQA